MKKPVVLISCIVLSILSLSLVQIMFSNQLSTNGAVLDRIQTQIKEYKTANTILEEKVLKLSSLTLIASESAAKGFVAVNSQVVLTDPIPLAYKQ